MRLPVSSGSGSRQEAGRAAVLSGFVGRTLHPSSPEDAHPRTGEDTDRVRMVAAARSGTRVDVCRPWGGVPGGVRPGRDSGAQPAIAGPAKGDAPRLPALVSNGTDACFRSELLLGQEALADVPELGEDLSGVDLAGAREGHDELAIFELPVARRAIPAPSTQPVSWGPSSGERAWLWWKVHGRPSTAALSIAALPLPEVQQ